MQVANSRLRSLVVPGLFVVAVGLVVGGFVFLSRAPSVKDEPFVPVDRRFPGSELAGGVTVSPVRDDGAVVEEMRFFIPADVTALDDAVTVDDPETMLVSFPLVMCELVPSVSVAFDDVIQAIDIEVAAQQESGCQETARSAALLIRLASGIEPVVTSVRTVP